MKRKLLLVSVAVVLAFAGCGPGAPKDETGGPNSLTTSNNAVEPSVESNAPAQTSVMQTNVASQSPTNHN